MTDTVKATKNRDDAIAEMLGSPSPAARAQARMIAALHDSYQAWLIDEGEVRATAPEAIMMAIMQFSASGIVSVLEVTTNQPGDKENIEWAVQMYRRVLTVGLAEVRRQVAKGS